MGGEIPPCGMYQNIWHPATWKQSNLGLKRERHKYRPKKLLAKKARKNLNLTYKMIGYGKKRIAYDIDNGLLLKIAITTSGIKNNMTEVEIYQTVSSKLRRHLAKVKEHGHGWLIMKKIKKEVRTKRNKSELKRVQRKFESRGVSLMI